MDDKYICPQCGTPYNAPGECDTCQVALQPSEEDDELEGFQTDDEETEENDDDDLSEEDFALEGDEDEANEESEDDEYETDRYEDQDNY